MESFRSGSRARGNTRDGHDWQAVPDLDPRAPPAQPAVDAVGKSRYPDFNRWP